MNVPSDFLIRAQEGNMIELIIRSCALAACNLTPIYLSETGAGYGDVSGGTGGSARLGGVHLQNVDISRSDMIPLIQGLLSNQNRAI